MKTGRFGLSLVLSDTLPPHFKKQKQKACSEANDSFPHFSAKVTQALISFIFFFKEHLT